MIFTFVRGSAWSDLCDRWVCSSAPHLLLCCVLLCCTVVCIAALQELDELITEVEQLSVT